MLLLLVNSTWESPAPRTCDIKLDKFQTHSLLDPADLNKIILFYFPTTSSSSCTLVNNSQWPFRHSSQRPRWYSRFFSWLTFYIEPISKPAYSAFKIRPKPTHFSPPPCLNHHHLTSGLEMSSPRVPDSLRTLLQSVLTWYSPRITSRCGGCKTCTSQLDLQAL